MPVRPLLLALLLVLLPMLSPACAPTTPPPPAASLPGTHPLAGRIWQPAQARFVTPAEAAAQLAAARVVSLGETHDNPDHHALQAWAVRGLARPGLAPSLAFEMIDRDQQPALDAALPDLDHLGTALAWEQRGWPDWRLYQPIAAAALEAGGRLAAANLPADATRALARGTAPADLLQRLGLDQPLPADAAADLAEEIRASHCGLMPEAAIPGMVRVQRARDASLAETLRDLAASTPGPVVLIAGSGHARTDRGAPRRLHALAPEVTQIALGFVEVEDGVTDPAAYAARFHAERLPFDLVWFTPRAEREDPCAAFLRQREKKQEQGGQK